MLVVSSAVMLLCIFVTRVDCGAPCPSRLLIHPCYCTTVDITNSTMFTIVTCRHIPKQSALRALFTTFRSMDIDRFVLYDSYWEAETYMIGKTMYQRMLPQNWISLLRIKELEVIDTFLSHCFACDVIVGCPNPIPTKLTFHNSSNYAQICTICENEIGKFSWMACMPKLQHFTFVFNRLKGISVDFFPMPLHELTFVNMSNNDIKFIEKNAFVNLPNLKTLDLSHNTILSISNGIFGKKENKIDYLDFSYNHIGRMSSDIFNATPLLVTFKMRTNFLTKLDHGDWNPIPPAIEHIDLHGNLIDCECNLTWINREISSNVTLLGYCITPGYENSELRLASDYLNEKCNNEGEGWMLKIMNQTDAPPVPTHNETLQERRQAEFERTFRLMNVDRVNQTLPMDGSRLKRPYLLSPL